MNLELCILFGGVLHFVILIASAQTPRLLDWNGQLAKLPKHLRTLFWVYGAFIVLTIVGFGTLSLLFCQEIAAGSPLARGFAAFIAVFWIVRLAIQFWIFDASAMLTRPIHRIGYHALSLIFIAVVFLYGTVALHLEIFV